MEKFKTFTSKVCPIPLSNIDTDMIIPAQYLTSTSREGYGQNVFRRMRDEDGGFALNKDEYRQSQILLADDNFGCGSSREHAVWAIAAWGFKVVIAKSFADIFFSNSAKNGLLLISLPADVVDSLLKKSLSEDLNLRISLEDQSVTDVESEESYSFEYDPFRKHCLLEGLDDIDYILRDKEQITNFRTEQDKVRFSK